MNKIYNNVYTYVLKFKKRTYELQIKDKIQYNDAYYQTEKKTRLITEYGKLHFFNNRFPKDTVKVYKTFFSKKYNLWFKDYIIYKVISKDGCYPIGRYKLEDLEEIVIKVHSEFNNFKAKDIKDLPAEEYIQLLKDCGIEKELED